MTSEEKKKFVAETYRDFMLFFGLLFFTCVVGIIELLPEFEKTNGLFSASWMVVSVVYFGLLSGISYSVHKCFFILSKVKEFAGEYAFRFPLMDYWIKKVFRKPELLEGFLIAVITLVLVLLYLVKIGVLQ